MDPTDPKVRPAQTRSDVDRQILSLAAPAFAALIAEPLMVLADSAMVGHLGETPLAGLALGSTITTTVIYLFVFLAYTTTTAAARALGSGNASDAIRKGLDGMWFAAIIGVIVGPLTWATAPWVVAIFGAEGAVAANALTYVRASAPGITAMFVVLAATGALRGLLDTKTPMWVSVGGTIFNAATNYALIYGLGWGITGSGAGTSTAQWLMAIVLVCIVAVKAHHRGVSLRPSLSSAREVGMAGAPLMVRTVNLRIAFLVTTWAATRVGASALAGHQIVTSVWNLGSYAMDALAIASQALIGHSLGTGDHGRVRIALKRCLTWGLWVGFAVGIVFAALSWLLPRAFTTSAPVIAAATWALIIAGVGQPLAGYVFILDGVLMGADRTKFLAGASIINLLVYLPFCCIIAWSATNLGETWGLLSIWVAFTFVFTAMRALTNRYGSRDLLKE